MMNELLREANKMADKMLLKAKIDNAKKDAKEWLGQEVDGITRAKIIGMVLVPAILVFLFS